MQLIRTLLENRELIHVGHYQDLYLEVLPSSIKLSKAERGAFARRATVLIPHEALGSLIRQLRKDQEFLASDPEPQQRVHRNSGWHDEHHVVWEHDNLRLSTQVYTSNRHGISISHEERVRGHVVITWAARYATGRNIQYSRVEIPFDQIDSLINVFAKHAYGEPDTPKTDDTPPSYVDFDGKAR